MSKKDTVKTVTIAVATGVVVGVVATAVYYANSAVILKEAKWTPDGDMLLSFYHRTNSILIPKP